MTDILDQLTAVDDGRDTLDEATTPPHNSHAEEAVLASVLKAPHVMSSLIWLPAEDFYAKRYATIWRAMLDLWHRNTPIDFTTLASRLEAPDLHDASVGLADLALINLSVGPAANVEHYAKLVSDAAVQRRVIQACQRVAEKAWPRGVDVQDLRTFAEAQFSAVAPRSGASGVHSPEQWAEAFWNDLNARSSGQRTAVSTGLIDLDAMTLGLEAGGLYLLMGTPGTGKTELAMQIAMHVGQQHGPVVFASLEMSEVELAHRFARISRGMDRNRLAKGTLDEDELRTLSQVMEDMQVSRFWPASPSGRYTTADLRADALKVRSESGHVALIVADYVQRFRDRATNTSSREENIGLVAENLKSLAREFACPVLAPVQPNREYVSRADRRPVLSDLRESGKLEQEADVVFGLYRDEKHNDETHDRGIAEIHMLKNRSGVGDSEGKRKIVWRETRYDNFTTEPHAMPWNAGRDD